MSAWPPNLPLRHENLIGRGNRVARRRPARDDVNPSRDGRGAEATSRRQRGGADRSG